MTRTYYSEEKMQERICCPIVELRQYTLHPGQREVLIELFEREFIESQEAVGMNIIGQFRDSDNPNRFVWLRGFGDMKTRAHSLGAFYGGPVWKAHRDRANATMVDSDNVLLLHTARPDSGFVLESNARPPAESTEDPDGLITATTYTLDGSRETFIDFFERTLKPLFMEAGAFVVAYFVTENSRNNYPALPVREGEQVFVWFALYEDEAAYELYEATLAGLNAWSWKASKELMSRIKGRPEVLRLAPTSRSLLHG